MIVPEPTPRQIAIEVIKKETDGGMTLDHDSKVKVVQKLWKFTPSASGWGLAFSKSVVDGLIDEGTVGYTTQY